jgi:hypothetical protein
MVFSLPPPEDNTPQVQEVAWARGILQGMHVLPDEALRQARMIRHVV